MSKCPMSRLAPKTIITGGGVCSRWEHPAWEHMPHMRCEHHAFGGARIERARLLLPTDGSASVRLAKAVARYPSASWRMMPRAPISVGWYAASVFSWAPRSPANLAVMPTAPVVAPRVIMM